MAITTTTFTKAVGWAKTDVIYQLESAFSYLGWHGSSLSGIVTGIVGVQTGGNLGISTWHTNVLQSSTSGIGTGASFDINRSGTNNQISAIYVNRPGAGYTDGEVVQIPASAIGGGTAVGIALTVKIAGNASPIGFGSTSTFFTKDVSPSGTNPWGVMRHTIQANKKYGDIYRAFQVNSSTSLRIYTGPFFHPGGIADNNNTNLGMGYTNTFRGDQLLDTLDSAVPLGDGTSTRVISSSDNYGYNNLDTLTYANSTSYALNLNVYKSGIDSKFAVFSYSQPTLSSLKLTDNNFDTFFFHNFNSSLWDYDNVFLGGMTKIIPGTTSTPSITFRTFTASRYTGYYYSTAIAKRSAELGYASPDTSGNYGYGTIYIDYVVESNAYDQQHDTRFPRIYYRNSASTIGNRSYGGYQNQKSIDSNANFNAVIKGIPLNGNMIPIPYYIPDDFVLIDFDYSTPSANIQQGDTVTISGSEVYTVITGSYNQTTRTRGILFCARTV